ncbi:MAG: hypothetical protein HOP96_00595 [Sphingomonas sp.]|nr:hypothetical protein [Sphingomonas sp.]
MSDSRETEAKRKSRLRWVTLGEAIAIAALIVSAVGVWLSYKGDDGDKGPSTVVEKRQAIPLTLRGKVQSDGRSLEIAPVESSHALQSLKVTIAGSDAIEVGSEGDLGARDVESALGKNAVDGKGTHRVTARIVATYVEAGADKSATGSYVISYRWEGGGLFGGRSLRLVGLSR